jgi:hypothetical protein
MEVVRVTSPPRTLTLGALSADAKGAASTALETSAVALRRRARKAPRAGRDVL